MLHQSGHQGISAVIPTQMITILQKWFINITPHPQQKGKTRESLEHKAKCGYRLNVQVLIVSDSQPCHVILTKQGPREYSVTWCFLLIALLINLEMWIDPILSDSPCVQLV